MGLELTNPGEKEVVAQTTSQGEWFKNSKKSQIQKPIDKTPREIVIDKMKTAHIGVVKP